MSSGRTVDMQTIKWEQVRIGDVIEFETRSRGRIRGFVCYVSTEALPAPIEASTVYGGFALYRDTNPMVNVVARKATFPARGDFSIFG
jgi:hypothetical protein